MAENIHRNVKSSDSYRAHSYLCLLIFDFINLEVMHSEGLYAVLSSTENSGIVHANCTVPVSLLYY